MYAQPTNSIHPYQAPTQVRAPTPAHPPTFEGTALSATIGCGAGALVAQGIMTLSNIQPQTTVVNGLITAGAAAFGGTVSSMAYRMGARRAYESAQYSCSQTGVSPNQAVSNFRISGRLGKLGNIEANFPIQGILSLAQAYQNAKHPATPDAVNKYYETMNENLRSSAGQSFVDMMPPPSAWAAPQPPPAPQPQPAYYPPQPQPAYYPPQPPPQYAPMPQWYQPTAPPNGQ